MSSKWNPTPKQRSILEPYGVDYDQPEEWRKNIKFGMQRLPLLNQERVSTQEDESEDGLYYPTTSRLVAHVGLLENVYNNIPYYTMLQADTNELIRRESMASIELERKVLTPIRKQMEKRLSISFYRFGSVVFEPDRKGLVTIVAHGIPMARFTPLSVGKARELGMSDVDIKLIATDAILVLEKKKLAHRSVRDELQLLTLIDGWLAYIPDGKVRKRLYESFKKMTPCLVGKKVTQLLLHA